MNQPKLDDMPDDDEVIDMTSSKKYKAQPNRKFQVGAIYSRALDIDQIRDYFFDGSWKDLERRGNETLLETEVRLFGPRPYSFLNREENNALGRTVVNNKRSRSLEETGEVEPDRMARKSRRSAYDDTPKRTRPKSQFGRTEFVDQFQRCYRRESGNCFQVALKPGQERPALGDMITLTEYKGRSLSMQAARRSAASTNSRTSGEPLSYIVEGLDEWKSNVTGLVFLGRVDPSVPIGYRLFVQHIQNGPY